MAKTQPLSVDLLRMDLDTQARIAINQEVVEEYAEVIEAGNGEWTLGAIDVFHDGSEYMVADGFHRTLAAKRSKRASVPCRVHKGTAWDAKVYGMTANDRHGLRMTQADKRACVEWLLENNPKMTQSSIAAAVGVSRRLVQGIVADAKQKAQNALLPPSEGGVSGEDDGTDAAGTTPQESSPGPPRKGKDKAGDSLGKCPNCGKKRWEQDEFGWVCSACHHPHGEPAGDVDDRSVKTQISKTVKTAESLMRAFDDLQQMRANSRHSNAIITIKALISVAEAWS